MLCQGCNHFRLHGETIQETQQKQNAKYIENAREKTKNRPISPPKIYTIKQSSSKNTTQKAKLSELKFSISEEALLNDEYYCKGCGHSNGGLDRSHILSVKQRPDLELDKDNIDLLCRTCHNHWESWDIFRMAALICFERYLKYIFSKDEETFFKIFIKMEEVQFDEENKISTKIVNLVIQWYKKLT